MSILSAALRHQLNILQHRAPRRLNLRWVDRALLIWLYRRFPRILDAVTIVRPETVVRWHRMGYVAFWQWNSRRRGGRPWIGKEVRDLIRRMSIFGLHAAETGPAVAELEGVPSQREGDCIH